MSKEIIQQISPKANREIRIFGRRIKPIDMFQDYIHNPSEKGWNFGAGDPEFWKFSDRLIVPGGKALDLGMGLGRTSVPFALQGMEVTGYENNPNTVRIARGFIRGMDLPITVKSEDVRSADLGKNIYDTLLLGETFIHFESEEEALKVIDKAIDAVKPGGHIWLRGPGRQDSKYLELALQSYMNYFMNPFQNPDEQPQDSLMAPCNCSGEWKMESHLFFNPVGLVEHMARRNINIVHTQIIPESGKVNIMFGEDWEKSMGQPKESEDLLIDKGDNETEEEAYGAEKVDRIYGTITILGQKR